MRGLYKALFYPKSFGMHLETKLGKGEGLDSQVAYSRLCLGHDACILRLQVSVYGMTCP